MSSAATVIALYILALWVKILNRRQFEIYSLFLPENRIKYHANCLIARNVKSCLLAKIRKTITDLSSAELS